MKSIASRIPGALLAMVMAGVLPAMADESPTEVQIADQVVGDGAEVRRGWFAIMHFTGWVYDEQAPEHKGRQFVDSRERGKPTTFVYGYQRALIGVEKGMLGMKVGGKRTIVVPPKLGYDELKYARPKDVPPKSALVFEVELLDVVPEQNPN
jgi:FKBP-type peptidyl-prolyl cis-trans isomerase FkpA